MSNDVKLYSFSSVREANLNDEKILNLLKEIWNYSSSENITIFGQVSQIHMSNHSFWIIDKFYHIKTGEKLLYPVPYQEGVKQNIYIGKIQEKTSEKIKSGDWVKAIVMLSPLKEREQHQNPFELNAIEISLLKEIPSSIKVDIFESNNLKLIESQWHDILYYNISSDIEKELSIRNGELSKIQEKIESSNGKIAENNQKIKDNTLKISKLESEISSLENKLTEYQKEVNKKMKKLNKFIENQAQFLKNLDLIDEEIYHQFVKDINGGLSQTVESHLTSDFDNDIGETVAFIQAFLYQQGIIYSRKVLEDFFALINTHDLIVLAGDSGSGKTNLVKSFAKAIGGKAIIIPVKPNWTSAEDLLGYYNPLEQKYLITPFLQAIFEAIKNPETPYFICLDEMNLARVEYYFADFLSLMEERSSEPVIQLYSESESNQVINEVKMFLSIIDDIILDKNIQEFVDLLKDENINKRLHEACGFKEGDSLLKYHSYLRRLLSSYLTTPSSIKLPANVRIIGAINIDETTHYLSPKILDRAHIMRFSSPLLLDWDEIENEIKSFDLDMNLPIIFNIDELGIRQNYPNFDKNDESVKVLVDLAKNYLNPIGVEFGLRTIRQAQNYAKILKSMNYDNQSILNNIIIHKILPKLMFDGEKQIKDLKKLDILKNMRDYLANQIGYNAECIFELDQMIDYATKNDSVVNYWAR